MKVNMIFLCSFVLTLSWLFISLGEPFIQAITTGAPIISGKLRLVELESNDWTEAVRTFEVEEAAEEVTVLMYHRILAEEDLESWHYDANGEIYDTIVLRDAFEEQINYLSEQGYVALTLKEFQLFIVGKLEIPKKSVLITFDDGFKDNFTEAYPILKRHQFNALLFLITGSVASGDPLYLSEADLIEGADVFEYQSHTDALHHQDASGHAYLVTKKQKEVQEDLSRSIDKLGGRQGAFAYPYGLYEQAQVQLLSELGFQVAFTVEYKQATQESHLLEIPRIGVYPEDTIADFKLKFN